MIEYYLKIYKIIKKLRKTNTISLFCGMETKCNRPPVILMWSVEQINFGKGYVIMNNKRNDRYEQRKHSSLFVPYSYYESAIPALFPFVPMHSHQEWELNLVTEGNGKLITDHTEAVMQEGDIILLCPFTLHAIESDDMVTYDTVVFHTDMFGATGDRCFAEEIAPLVDGNMEMIFVRRETERYEEMVRSARNIVECAKANTAHTDLLMKSELLRLLWLAEESGACHHTPMKVENDQIRQVIDFIHDNYMEALSLGDMAQKASLSKSWFMQKFKETTGISAMEYLNRLRIQKVCRLIRQRHGISEAAYACGFRNLSNFNRLFKSIVGMTPREYLYKYHNDEKDISGS